MDGKHLILIGIMLLLINFSGCIDELTQPATTTVPQDLDSMISIACWNLQIFGPSKAANISLLNYYAENLAPYDIFIIQEIRDASGTAIETLSTYFPDHDYIISARAGQSSSKEQYAFFYTSEVTIQEVIDHQQYYQDTMQRPPLQVILTVNNWTATIYTVHTQPDRVTEDLHIVEDIIGSPTGDIMVIGDLNADGIYYDEDTLQHFIDWQWVTSNMIDTTVAPSNNTYDRIIINQEMSNNYLSSGIMDDVTTDQSDHYLVYGIFSTDHP